MSFFDLSARSAKGLEHRRTGTQAHCVTALFASFATALATAALAAAAGVVVPFSSFRSKVVLVVNVASL